MSLFKAAVELADPMSVSTIHGMLLTHIPLDKMASILADDIFKCIFLNKNDIIQIRVSLKFVPRIPIDNNPAYADPIHWRIYAALGEMS